MPIQACILRIGHEPQTTWDTGDAVEFTLAVADPEQPILPRRWYLNPTVSERIGYELVDPALVTFSLRDDEGTVVTHTYGTSDDLLQDPDETGQYRIVLPVDESGVHTYRWAVSGDYVGAEEAEFTVQVSPFNTPVIQIAPLVTGEGTVGQVLSCDTGTWSRDPTSFAYQWLRDGTPIVGETADTYTLVFADYLTGVSCEVTATNESGDSTAESNTISVDVPIPINTVLPLVTVANAIPGALLTATSGTWTASSVPTYEYQWVRCDAAGANGVDIGGATATTYVLTETDIDSTLRVRVTATDIYGEASIESDATDVVHFPSQNVFINPLLGGNTNVNWSSITQGASAFLGGVNTSTGAQNASISFDFYAEASTYTLDILYLAGTDRGIFRLSIDGVTLDTDLDGYAAAPAAARSTITNLLIPTTGVHSLTLTMAEKNPLGSSYIGSISGIGLTRTGD